MSREDELREALKLARPLVEKWCHYQGNTKELFDTYLGPIDKALLASPEPERADGGFSDSIFTRPDTVQAAREHRFTAGSEPRLILREGHLGPTVSQIIDRLSSLEAENVRLQTENSVAHDAITCWQAENVRLTKENAELKAADRDHLAAKQGMERRLTDTIDRLEAELATLKAAGTKAEGIEAAAKVADKFAEVEKARAEADTDRSIELHALRASWWSAAMQIAKSIRALSPAKPEHRVNLSGTDLWPTGKVNDLMQALSDAKPAPGKAQGE